ncbi:MAG: hypothetical protein WC279_12145 [Sulfurimonas sp.]|uniref:hypothetical protein n=1 Tax=Sulfurimonas sp. TaxID=2022749 RepID=UPI0035661552
MSALIAICFLSIEGKAANLLYTTLSKGIRLMMATSDPKQKDTVINLIVNILAEEKR